MKDISLKTIIKTIFLLALVGLVVWGISFLNQEASKTEEEAEKWINAHNPPKDKQYKGYDGKYYPYYVKIPINSISLNDTK